MPVCQHGKYSRENSPNFSPTKPPIQARTPLRKYMKERHAIIPAIIPSTIFTASEAPVIAASKTDAKGLK